jgi:CIC family chloride channel protein
MESNPRVSNWLTDLLDRWRIPAEAVLLATALVVGLSTGVGAVLLHYLIQGVEWIGYEWAPEVLSGWGNWYVVIVPAVGGLPVGLLVYFFAREAKGHGVPEVMEAVALRGGRIRPQVAIVKALASSLSIGSGGSVGREGPIVQIGSALGSTIGQSLNLTDERVRNLVACGAAGGIAAAFNTPIAGVLFALEVILGRFDVRYFSSVVISAVAASVVGRAAFGNAPAFRIPFEYGINSLWEFVFYPVLGLLAAGAGVLFIRVLYAAEDLFDRWKQVPEWFQPAVGGVMLGLLALAYPLLTGVTWQGVPQVFNVGYDVIESVLAGELALGVVAALLVLKLLATSITLGSGGSGGVFAPALFMGAMLGAAFAMVVEQIIPGVAAPSGAYALVGMGAMFAACAHAPITAVLMLFELTGDYRIILPLMVTVVISTLVAQRLTGGESIYTLKLARRGVHLQRGRDIDVLQSVRVEEVMSHNPDSVPLDMTITELTQVFSKTRHHGLLVTEKDGTLWGIVTVRDLDWAWSQKRPRTTPVSAIGTTWPRLKVAFADETMGEALSRMGVQGFGRLPVVTRDNPYQIAGIIRREDIIKAYDMAVTRRAELQQLRHEQQMPSGMEEDTEFVEIILTPDDAAVGQKLSDIASAFPNDCVLVSIRRDEQVLIPHGDTVFAPGDHIVAFTRSNGATQLFHCLRSLGTADE